MAPVSEQALLDIDRSNKGASKQRRDQINGEINSMRDLLPLPASSRQRLSQLQIMSLSCVYIRKCNVLQKLVQCQSMEQNIPDSLDFLQALTGFLLVTTREGKLVYISENVTDYLGHSMVDMKTQGDSLYDIVDKRDHGTMQAQLLQGDTSVDLKDAKDVSFFCRMNMTRTLKRHSGFGDVKVMHVRGHFVQVSNNAETMASGSNIPNQQVFMALCSPLITPDLKENLVQNNTMVFKTVHQLDMTFVEVTQMAEYYLGFTSQEMNKKSWYSMLHPEDIHEAKDKHTQLIRSNHEMGCMMTVRMLTADNSIVWLNIVMHVKQSSLSHCEESHIVCINQVISAQEAYQIKMQARMFSVYPGHVPEMWADPMANHTASSSSSNGNQWIQQQNGSHIPMASSYQIGMPVFVNQTEFPATYHPACRSSQMPAAQGEKVIIDIGQGKMSNGVHTDKLKAMLKRKIQGPGISCQPMKMQKMSWHYNGIQDGNDFTELGQMNHGDDHHTYTDETGVGNCHNDSVQVLQANNNNKFGLHQIKKMPKRMSRSEYINLSRHGVQSNISQVSQEQVVPDVNVPESYLTPDPSPISSPEPSQVFVKMETMDSERMSTDGKSSVSILHALEKLASLPQGNRQCSVPHTTNNAHCTSWQGTPSSSCKKGLPIFDAFDIDNFFDGLEIPEQISKMSAKVEDMKWYHKVKTEMHASSPTGTKNLAYMPEIKKEIPCYSPPIVFQSCNSPSVAINMYPDHNGALTKVKLEEFDLIKRNSSISSSISEVSGLNDKDVFFTNVTNTMVESPSSVGSQETSAGTDSFDSLLSCFSDDGLDLSPLQTDPRSTILKSSLSESMLMEQFEMTHEKFYATNSQCKSLVRHDGCLAPEDLSQHSSPSSLAEEDDILDHQFSLSVDPVLVTFQSPNFDEICNQRNMKDQKAHNMRNALAQMDLFFNSFAEIEADFPKHSQ